MLEVNKNNFETEVLGEKRPVFVEFWGEKCQTCLKIMPQVEALEEIYGDKIKFASINTSKNMRLAIGQKVLGLPTIVIYVNGEKEVTLNPDKISSVSDIETVLKEHYNKL